MSDLIENGTIVEAFGEFLFMVDGKRKSASNLADAEAAVTEAAVGEGFRAEAAEYCVANLIEGKNAQGKINQIVSFLVWQAAGKPVKVAEEKSEEQTEAELEVATAPDEAPELGDA